MTFLDEADSLRVDEHASFHGLELPFKVDVEIQLIAARRSQWPILWKPCSVELVSHGLSITSNEFQRFTRGRGVRGRQSGMAVPSTSVLLGCMEV